MRRISFASVVAVAALIAVPTGASAATTTIGQLAPASPLADCANPDPYDVLQPTVSSGNLYVVPANGTITSWSHQAAPAPAGQKLKFKIFRKLAGANEYQVVTQDVQRELTEGALNTFSVSIPVTAGDFIGLNDLDVPNACAFAVGGETGFRERLGDLAIGQSGTFATRAGVRMNLTAVLTTPDPVANCGGETATILGTPEGDDLTGTPERDIITGLGGKDEISGLAGKDLICGGKGKDTLRGGKGKDKLLGQGGRDKLVGGGGKDVCKGGKKDDIAKKCEIEKSI